MASSEDQQHVVVWDRVCFETELKKKQRMCFTMPSTNRHVMLFHLNERVYCMDQACYHHGGPLIHGDIEELGEKLTVKCPWHNYQIVIETGEGLYIGYEIHTDSDGTRMQRTTTRIKSKGVKQRVHPVEIRDKVIYVTDASKLKNAEAIESDMYAYQEQTILSSDRGQQQYLHSSSFRFDRSSNV